MLRELKISVRSKFNLAFYTKCCHNFEYLLKHAKQVSQKLSLNIHLNDRRKNKTHFPYHNS